MATITWKGGAVLLSTIIGSIVGLKKLVTGESIVTPPESGITSLSQSNNFSDSFPVAEEEYKDTNQNFSEAQEIKHVIAEEPFSSSTYTVASEGERFTDSESQMTPDKTFYYWGRKYTPEIQKKNREEAKRIYEILNDYSFKIHMPCTYGTGWILDYQIPEKDKYPTKWYIATAAHVIQGLAFSDNPYSQLLPKSHTWTQHLRENGKKKQRYEEMKKHEREIMDTCWAVNWAGHIDLNLSQQGNGPNRKADVGAVSLGEMEEPKLFFSAFNFLDKGIGRRKYFSDFAVLEITFTSEDAAKRATNNFATNPKYKNGSRDVINVFSEPIEKKYKTEDGEQLWKALQRENKNYYNLGYGWGAKDKWTYTKNWDEQKTLASTMGGYTKADNIRTDESAFLWQGDKYNFFGHLYRLEHNPVKGGGSGGIYVDGEGNAFGVVSVGGRNSTWVQPLRSVGTTVEREGMVTPKYDLILGVDGQENYYKKQVEEYILKQGGKTWLSERGNWTVPVQQINT
ncbi:hypothetical protein DNK47_03295 [Mycoplasma wenyonii]|uniref:DUF31 domain-containing protein n=1 Tax=Mycoplasma wenyonii TaxID=65123 RepID=A0A328PSN9_9MOLU|nr:hypothetical protein [Mycoplasma wenyonii]RAO94760.1 hypothetical protein DNK47_03295 [Mycoplasma wenyonii]